MMRDSRSNAVKRENVRLQKLRYEINILAALKMKISEELMTAKVGIAMLECDMEKKRTEISKIRQQINISRSMERMVKNKKKEVNES
ncbi:unnamed protein product [Nezara viridula]|uniref:Uncharacterized protein n=1 Tax=Nezara viridula TaxID=85310 RepID=A0A9P0H865_NEZVI|nr:unnamed protein product [Nezara viridula]